MSKKKKIIGVVCGVVAVAVVGGYLLLNQNSGAAVMVSTETLQQMDLQNTVSLTGVVESETDRKVYSTLSYLVESVNVQVGDVVQAGDVLAQLDTEQLEMDIAQQQAAVDASNSQSAHQIEVNRKAYENAKENYENGLDSNAISAESGVNQAESSLIQAEYGVDSAKLQVDAAEAAVRDARENYRITRDQLNGNVDSAREALDDAEDALAEAEAAYNKAVANATSNKEAQLAAAEAARDEKLASYQPALDEWEHLEETYLADIETEKKEEQDIEDKLDQQFPGWDTEENYQPQENEQEYKKLIGDLETAEGKVRTAQETYVQQKSIFQNIQSQYNQAITDYQNQVASIESAAQSGLSAAQSGVASAQTGVASAEAQLDAARDARNGSTLTQLEQGIASANRSVDSAELQEDIAKAQQDAAEQSADTAKQQQAATENSIAQQIDTLKDNLIGSQIAAQSTKSQEIAIQSLQDTLADATITAPVSGVVTAVYAEVGEPGNGLLFVIEDTDALKITTNIREYDVGNIEVGMPVVIRSDATGDKEISGTVTYIAPAANKTENGNTLTADDSTVEFEAEVQVNDTDSGLRIGMNTRLTVLLEERDNVYGVPYDAVVEKADGSEVVYAVEPSSEKEGSYVVTEVPVTTGLETDFYIEVSGDGITDGLSIVSDPQSVAPGMEVTPDFVATGTTPVTTDLSSEPVVGLSSESGAE